jgi:hypothetical protein
LYYIIHTKEQNIFVVLKQEIKTRIKVCLASNIEAGDVDNLPFFVYLELVDDLARRKKIA